MSAVHGLLSKLPETVDYEEMVTRAVRLYREHPPSQLARTAGVKPSSRWVELSSRWVGPSSGWVGPSSGWSPMYNWSLFPVLRHFYKNQKNA